MNMKNIIKSIATLLFVIILPPKVHAQETYKPFIPLTVNYTSGISPEGDILIGYSIDQLYLSLADESDFLHLDIQLAEKDSIKNSNNIKQILWANKDTVFLFIYQLDLLTGSTKSFVLFSGDKCKTFRLITIFNSAIQYAQLLDNNELYLSVAFMNFYVTPDFGKTWYQEITEVPVRYQNTFIFNYSAEKRTATYFSNSGLYINKKAHKKYIPYKTIENWQTISLPKTLKLSNNVFDKQVEQLIVSNDTILITANNKVYYTDINKIQWHELANARNFVYDKSGVFYIQTSNDSIYKYNTIAGEKKATPFNAKNKVYNLQTVNCKCYALCRDSIFMVDEKSISVKPLLVRNESIPVLKDTIIYNNEIFQWKGNEISKQDPTTKTFYRLAKTPFKINYLSVLNEKLYCIDFFGISYEINPVTGNIKLKETENLNLENISLADTMLLEYAIINTQIGVISDLAEFRNINGSFVHKSDTEVSYLPYSFFKDTISKKELDDFFQNTTDAFNEPLSLNNLGLSTLDISNFIKAFESNNEVLVSLYDSLVNNYSINLPLIDANKNKIIVSARGLTTLNEDSLTKILANYKSYLNDFQMLKYAFEDLNNTKIEIDAAISHKGFIMPIVFIFYQNEKNIIKSLPIYQQFVTTFTPTEFIADNKYKIELILNLILSQHLPK